MILDTYKNNKFLVKIKVFDSLSDYTNIALSVKSVSSILEFGNDTDKIQSFTITKIQETSNLLNKLLFEAFNFKLQEIDNVKSFRNEYNFNKCKIIKIINNGYDYADGKESTLSITFKYDSLTILEEPSKT